MTTIKQGLLLGFAALLSASMQLHAAGHEHEKHEGHAAHVHGEAELLVALEGDTLEIEFASPAMNIVGFEHQPADEAQFRAVRSATKTLQQTTQLFVLTPAAGCVPLSAETRTPIAEQPAHGHEQMHGHAEKTVKDHGEAHSDFTAHYRFHCGEGSKLERIVVDIFNQFPGLELIKAQTISNKGQQADKLTPEHNSLYL